MFEMSKHSMRRGRLSRLSTSRSSSSAAIRLERAAVSDRGVDSSASCAFSAASSTSRRFSPRSGVRTTTARAATLAEELGEHLRIRDPRRDEHLRRCARRGAVVLEDERLDDRLRVLSFDVLEVESVAVDHLAVAQREDLHRRLVAVDREPDDVDRPDVAPIGRLPVGEVPDREQPVPVARGLLEALLRPQLPHPLGELRLDRLRVPREEPDDALDHRAVVLLRDRSDARGEAAVDVEVEAGDPGVAPGRGPSHGRKRNTRFSTSSVSRTFFAFAYGPK